MSFSRLIRKIVQYRLCKSDPVSYAESLGVRVGENGKFHGVDLGTFGSEPYLVTIGNHVEITAKVKFLTHDGGAWVFREKEPDLDVFKPIKVGDNVFLGRGTILLPGAEIGDNVVIGAGAIVSGTIPSNCVCAGVPARKLRSLDEYRERIEAHTFMTKRMSREEKRRILEEKFYGGS